ncbi:MAG TPA: cytochrome c oxidase subunit 3 [Burkholderiaceae bacterium]
MSALAPPPSMAADPRETASLGMWVFLASEMLFFGIVLFVYAISRMHAHEGFAAASARTDVWLGTLNTALLLSSSCAIAIAAEAAAWGQTQISQRGLWIAVALGLVFVAIKGVEYHREWTEGLVPGPGFALHVPGAELFFAWYFFATALHAVHLLIGIAFCAGFALRRELAVNATRMHSLALYWHFVDAVWIFLYPLIYLVSPRS